MKRTLKLNRETLLPLNRNDLSKAVAADGTDPESGYSCITCGNTCWLSGHCPTKP